MAEEIKATFSALMSASVVKAGLAFLVEDHEDTLKELKKMVAIAAPTFLEKERGEYFAECLSAYGLDARTDSAGNVYAIRKGKGNGPVVVVDAHLDTVFPPGIDLAPVEKEGKIFAPGVGDCTAGLAIMLSVIKALNAARIDTVRDVIFLATTCHEGEGDLKGIKTFLDEHGAEISAIIHLEPSGQDIVYLATGSRRYEVTFSGQGGHSWVSFGLPSAIHAMGRAIAKIAAVEVPENPRTTFNIGVVKGGTSVNTIAAEAALLLDLRSVSEEELLRLESIVLPMFETAAREESGRRAKGHPVSASYRKIGDRPAGEQPMDARIVQVAVVAAEMAGKSPRLGGPMSTNANYSIKKGIPAVVISCVKNGAAVHSRDEWIETSPHEAQALLLTVLGLAGAHEITASITVRQGGTL
jgi:acetylornithine deacetylase/succinyl-diaminopimelate desuccinylase-like protein